MEAKDLLRQCKIDLLAQLPKNYECFFKWFLAITEVERPSLHLEKALPIVIEWGKKLGATYVQDEAGNICFSIPATPGKENIPSIVIQGHLDMVAVGKFDEGRVPVKIENGLLTSGVSTLGADDGVAIAAIFALMETEKTYVHGPLEFLVTVDEEVGLIGASKLAGPPFLKSRTMLNLDSEDWGIFYTSCAGGMNIWYEYDVHRDASFSGKKYKLDLSGFVSGHTGLVIQEGRCNAVKWMCRLLIAARAKGIDFRLISIAGGDKHNAIPKECTAELVVNGREAEFEGILKAVHADCVRETKSFEVKNPTLVISESNTEIKPMTHEDSERVLNLLTSIHHGVFRNHPEIPGLVLTSQSMSVTRFNGDQLQVQVFARTNESSHMDYLIDINTSLARLAGVNIRVPEDEMTGPWPAALGSKIMDVAKGVYKRLFGNEPKITGIHAGLECGCIQNRGYSDLEAISYGPDLHGAHTEEENCSIDTMAKCFQLTIEIIKEWAK